MPEPDELQIESLFRRVRALAGGRWVFDTIRPLRVWEVPYYPTYYLPADDIGPGLLVNAGRTGETPSGAAATMLDLKLDNEVRSAAAYTRKRSDPEALAGLVAFRWDALDHWFEEDEEVFVHPRDPYTRIDILRSSRKVTVEINGHEIASSTNAAFLYETGLPVRYYLPKTDVRFDLVTASSTETHCPYKGTARYWNLTVGGTAHPDSLWGYDHPLPESQKIAGMVCFYNEKVRISIDGHPERPQKCLPMRQ